MEGGNARSGCMAARYNLQLYWRGAVRRFAPRTEGLPGWTAEKSTHKIHQNNIQYAEPCRYRQGNRGFHCGTEQYEQQKSKGCQTETKNGLFDA